jgi:hypothetical protein
MAISTLKEVVPMDLPQTDLFFLVKPSKSSRAMKLSWVIIERFNPFFGLAE